MTGLAGTGDVAAMTIKDVRARLLAAGVLVSESTVRRWYDARYREARRLGQRGWRRFTAADVAALIAEHSLTAAVQ